MEANTEGRTEGRTEKLVDQLLKTLFDQTSPEIKILVTHRYPDDDGWLCLKIAKMFIPKATNAQIVFVNAGETLPGSEGDSSIIHFDTGGGEYDQHSREFGKQRICSAVLLVQRLRELGHINPLDEAGLKPLLEMATAVDNVQKRQDTDLHFLIEGYRHFFNINGNIDWEKVQERVFEDFDIIYGQARQREESRQNLGRIAERTILSNGLKVTTILWHPKLREAAFEEGTGVVIWTVHKGSKGFYTGIQTNRDYPELLLANVVAELRFVENRTRNKEEVARKFLRYPGRKEKEPWFLHHSLALVANGTRSCSLQDLEEFTKLTPRQIQGITLRALSAIPREKVSQWTAK